MRKMKNGNFEQFSLLKEKSKFKEKKKIRRRKNMFSKIC